MPRAEFLESGAARLGIVPSESMNGSRVVPRRRTETDMNLTDILGQMGGLKSMAGELGVSEQQAASGAEALLPSILGGFKKQAQTQPGGVAGLGGLLNQLGGGNLLDDVLSPQPTNVDRGNNVLGEIFGSKDVSRAVAQDASAKTGIDPSVLKRMLPMLAMLAAGFMAKQASAGRTSEAAPAHAQAGGGLGGLLGGLLGGAGATGGGGLASMLDQDGNGNPLDDILRQVGKGPR